MPRGWPSLRQDSPWAYSMVACATTPHLLRLPPAQTEAPRPLLGPMSSQRGKRPMTRAAAESAWVEAAAVAPGRLQPSRRPLLLLLLLPLPAGGQLWPRQRRPGRVGMTPRRGTRGTGPGRQRGHARPKSSISRGLSSRFSFSAPRHRPPPLHEEGREEAKGRRQRDAPPLQEKKAAAAALPVELGPRSGGGGRRPLSWALALTF